jgi:hypothetical protein
MKIDNIITLISVGNFKNTNHWVDLREFIINSIKKIDHPQGSGKFLINPQKGKTKGQGNGVMPIKESFIRIYKIMDGN